LIHLFIYLVPSQLTASYFYFQLEFNRVKPP